MKRYIFVLLLLIPALGFAQTAERIEKLLEQESVSYAQAALFVLEAAEHLDPALDTNPDEAFNAARGFLPKKVQANDTINLKSLSFLVMQAFDIKGGLFYIMTKSPHHAYRELQRLNVIQGRVDPLLPVSGELLLFVINRTLFIIEE